MRQYTVNKNKYIILMILVILYLLIRLLILISSIDKLYLDEELYRGNVAKELISGPILPFFDYQRSEYEGGSLVIGVLAIPFFLLFGETLFSLKLVVLSLGIVTLIIWYLFLDKFFHRRVAILVSLLWIFSPPFYTKISLYPAGAFFEINFFTILAISIFYKIFFIKERKWIFAILGLVSGFALFFSYIFSVTLFTILLFWFIFDKKFLFGKNFLSFAVSFLVGFSPWLYYNLTHNFEGFIVADKPILYWFTQNSFLDSLMRLKNLITIDIRNSFGFEDVGFLNHRFLTGVYYLIFVLSFSVLFFLNRRSILKLVLGIIPHRRFKVLPKEISRDAFLIIFPAIFSIIFSFTGFEFYADFYAGYAYRYRYLIPLYPFVFTIIALFLHKITKASKYPLISYFNSSLMIILLCLGLVSNFNLVSLDNLGKGFIYKIYRGYNYYDLGKIICRRFSDAERWVESIKEINNMDDRRYCYAGMGWGIGGSYSYPYEMTVANYIKNIGNKIDKEYLPYAYERLGQLIGYNDKIAKELRDNLDREYYPYFYYGLGREAGKRLAYKADEYIRLIDRINEEYQPYFYEGIGIELDEILINETEIFVQFMNTIAEEFRPYIYKGLAEGKEYYQFNYDKFGFGIGRIGYDIRIWNEIIDKIQEEFRPYCYQRLGIEMGWRFIHDIKRYLKFLEQADERYWSYLYKGLGTGIGWRFGYNIKGCVQLIKQTDQRFWRFIYEGLGTGVARRHGYQLDDWAGEIEKVPSDYKSYFDEGLRETQNVWRLALN